MHKYDKIVRMNLTFLNTWHGGLGVELRQYFESQLGTTKVFCLQETALPGRQAYEDVFADYSPFYAEKISHLCHYGNTIYVHKSLKVIESGVLLQDIEHGGLANYVKVSDGDDQYYICNVHGVPRPGHKLDTPERLEQSRELVKFFKFKENVIIGGDFNLLPETDSVTILEKAGFRNLIKEYDIKTTRNEISYGMYPDNIQYYADYTFISPDVRLKNFTVPDIVVSDHQPLEIML